MGLTIAAPANEPLTSANAKEWLRVDTNDTSQDTTITLLISAARKAVEEYIRRATTNRTVTWVIDGRQGNSPLWLPRVPAVSITSFTTHNGKVGADDTVVNTANYELVEGTHIVTRADGWALSNDYASATVVYVAGYGADASDVPQDIRMGIYRVLTRLFEGRGDEGPAELTELIDPTTAMILAPYRYYL